MSIDRNWITRKRVCDGGSDGRSGRAAGDDAGHDGGYAGQLPDHALVGIYPIDVPGLRYSAERLCPRCGTIRRPPGVGAGFHDRGGGGSQGGADEAQEGGE